MAPAAVPLPRTPVLLARHAALALRAGRLVTLRAPDRELRVLAAGAAATAPRPWPAGASLVLADRRVAGPAAAGVEAWRLPLGLAAALADPPADGRARAVAGHLAPADALEAGAAGLCRLAGLPPLAVCLPPSAGTPGLVVPLEAVRLCRELEGLGLQPVSEAGVPLADAGDARLVAFRPADGGPDRLAILVGEPEAAAEPLCRLHSRPFAGDLLGSLGRGRDDRLRGAIRRMAGEGAGVLLRLVREGRGVGPGPGPDEDRFRAAAAMLRHLGIGRVRLLTDDPAAPRRLMECGIEVAGRVPTRPGPDAGDRGHSPAREGHADERPRVLAPRARRFHRG